LKTIGTVLRSQGRTGELKIRLDEPDLPEAFFLPSF
jgi:hypothetical protein